MRVDDDGDADEEISKTINKGGEKDKELVVSGELKHCEYGKLDSLKKYVM